MSFVNKGSPLIPTGPLEMAVLTSRGVQDSHSCALSSESRLKTPDVETNEATRRARVLSFLTWFWAKPGWDHFLHGLCGKREALPQHSMTSTTSLKCLNRKKNVIQPGCPGPSRTIAVGDLDVRRRPPAAQAAASQPVAVIYSCNVGTPNRGLR